MKPIYTLLLTLIWVTGWTQNLRTQNVISITPKPNTEVNGIGIGLTVSGMEHGSDSLIMKINGLCIELIGFGLLLPIVPSDPLIPYGMTEDDLKGEVLDSILLDLDKSRPYLINGVVISPGGLAGRGIVMNGMNLSGTNTFTLALSGFSTAILMNYSGKLSGVSIGIINRTLETRGVQIGLFNRTEKLRGIQLGLWNHNGKIGLPIINWNFR